MSDLIPIPQITPARAARLAMSEKANAAKLARIQTQRESFDIFWNSEATPDEILEDFGTDALRMLVSAQESVRHIATIAGLSGDELADVLPDECHVPRREFVVEIIDGSPTGRVTLAPPADGYDAWGRQIPETEPAGAALAV